MIIKFFEEYSKSSLTITVLIAVGIFYISSLIFGPGKPGGIELIPISYHISAFFLFGIFLFISFVKGKKQNIKFLIIAIPIAIVYALSDEIHQIFVPFRYCGFEDFILDIFGIFSATLIYLFVLGFRKI